MCYWMDWSNCLHMARTQHTGALLGDEAGLWRHGKMWWERRIQKHPLYLIKWLTKGLLVSGLLEAISLSGMTRGRCRRLGARMTKRHKYEECQWNDT